MVGTGFKCCSGMSSDWTFVIFHDVVGTNSGYMLMTSSVVAVIVVPLDDHFHVMCR